MHSMIEKARTTLTMLLQKSEASRGSSLYMKASSSKTASLRMAFESILDSLIPDDADAKQLISSISKLLGVGWETVRDSVKRKRDRSAEVTAGGDDVQTETDHQPTSDLDAYRTQLERRRKRRKDFRCVLGSHAYTRVYSLITNTTRTLSFAGTKVVDCATPSGMDTQD